MGYNKEGTKLKDLMLLIPGLLLVFHLPTISKNKGYENLAASIDSTNETFNQSYSKDFDSSEAPTFLDVLSFLCLLRSGGLEQSHAQLYEFCRQARKPSEGFLD